MTIMLGTLRSELARLGLALEDDVTHKLCAFGEAVVKQNTVMNLTAITEPAAVAKLHLLDSLTVLTAADLKGKQIIDVGCGAGFPGVPLAIACPEAKVTLLDSLGKRVKWLEETLPSLGVDAQCITARAEEAVTQLRESYDFTIDGATHSVIVLRKVAPTPTQYPRRYAKIKQSPL